MRRSACLPSGLPSYDGGRWGTGGGCASGGGALTPGPRLSEPGGALAEAAVQGLDLVYAEELLGAEAVRRMEFKETPGWGVLRARWRGLLTRRPVPLTEAVDTLREAW